MKKLFVALVAAIAAFATFAETYTWVGGTGSFSDSTKWESSSGGVPGEGADLVFPAGDNSVTDMGTITLGNISIGAGTTELKAGTDGAKITVNGVISGAGRLHANGTDGKTNYLYLKGENTFTGGLWLDGFRGYTYNNKSFGTGDVYVRAVSSNGAQLSFQSGTTEIANNIFIGREATTGIGSITVNANVRLTGNFTISKDGDCADRVTANTNVRFEGSGTLTFAGTVKAPKGVAGLIPAGGKLVFEQAISAAIGSAKFSFNGGTGLDLQAADNAISEFSWNNWSGNASTFKIFADNPISATYAGDLVISTGTAGGAKTFDLNGHKATIGGYTATKTDSVVTSSVAGGELTINAKANQSYAGSFNGGMTLIYNGVSTTNVYTLTGANNTMNGTLKVKSGTVALGAGAGMTALAKAEIDAGGAIAVDATAKFAARHLIINKASDAYGKLKPNGGTISVVALTVDGVAMAAGTYTGTDWIDGEGSVKVQANADSVLVWTGNAGGEWSTPGNWATLAGETLTRAIVSTDVLYISDATTDAKALVFSGAGVNVPNSIVLGAGKQIIQNNITSSVINFTGEISGEGGIAAKGKSTASYTRFSHANTFSGGVDRYYPARIDLFDAQGFGTGKVTLGDGSPSGGGGDNPGIYINGNYTIANDITIGKESWVSWNGWFAGKAGSTFHFTGDVTFTGQTRWSSAATFYFDGDTYIDTGIVGKNGQTLYFKNPIKRHGSSGSIFLDNSSGYFHLQAPSNNVTFGGIGAVSTVKIYLEAADALANRQIFWNAATKAGEYGTLVDLGGYNQSMAEVYDTVLDNPNHHFINSDSEAKLTLTALGATDRYFTGSLTGKASLELDSVGKRYNMYGGVHTTSGDLIAKAGTIKLYTGATAKNLRSLQVGATGAIEVADDAGEIAAYCVDVTTGGTITLPTDVTLNLHHVVIDGQKDLKVQEFTPENCTWLKGGKIVSGVAVKEGYLTYVGTGKTEWTDASNWLNDQGENEAPVIDSAQGTLSKLYITGASVDCPLISSQVYTLSNEIYLEAGVQRIRSTNGNKITLKGVISGPGQLYWECSAAQGSLQLGGVNTFEGGVVRDGRGMVICENGSALGTGPFVQKYSGNATASKALDLWAGTYANDLTFAAEGGSYGYDGCLVYYGEVHLTGNVRFEGDTRITGGGADSQLHFDGSVYVKGRLTTNNADGHYHFHTAVTGGGYLHTDQTRGYWHLYTAPSGFTYAHTAGGGSSNFLVPEVDGAFGESFYISVKNGSTGKGINLNGTEQVMDRIYEASDGPCNGGYIIKSAQPAKLTLKATQGMTIGATFQDAVSLDYAPNGAYTATIKRGVSTMEGTLTVSGGTFVLTDGASMLNLSAVEVADGATLNVDATAGGIAADTVTVEEGGTFEVGEGLVAKFVMGKAEGLNLAAGDYTKDNCTWVKGDGKVTITYDSDDKYIWTGADDGVYSNPANWLVNGEIPAAAPTSESGTLYIMSAGAANPMIITENTTIENDVVLGSGTQNIHFNGNSPTLSFTGKISGEGALYFNGAAASPNNLYYVQFHNTANDFAGGVTRAGAGQIRVCGSHVLGTGKVELAPGSANGSKIANYTPLYIGTTAESVLPNEFVVHDESYNSWNGWLDGVNNAKVRFAGDVKFAFTFGNYQTRFNSNATVYFDGNVSITGGNLICKSGVKIYFAKPVTGGTALWADNDSMSVHFQASNNDVGIFAWGVSTWNVYLEAENALAGKSFYVTYKESKPTSVTFDMCGKNQSMGSLYNTAPASAAGVTVTSATPATFTLTDSTSRTFDGKFAGEAAFTYAPGSDAAVYTLTGKNFLSGSPVTAKRGTIQLTGENSLHRASTLNLDGGKIQLDANQVVRTLQIAGVEQETGTWGAIGSGADHESEFITGEGILTVKGVSGVMLLIK